MKLFKAISSSGVLSRRKSMDAVKEAMVTVNGKLILDPSFEIQANDDIRLDNQKIIVKPFAIGEKKKNLEVYYPRYTLFGKNFDLITYTYYNRELLKKQIQLDFLFDKNKIFYTGFSYGAEQVLKTIGAPFNNQNPNAWRAVVAAEPGCNSFHQPVKLNFPMLIIKGEESHYYIEPCKILEKEMLKKGNNVSMIVLPKANHYFSTNGKIGKGIAVNGCRHNPIIRKSDGTQQMYDGSKISKKEARRKCITSESGKGKNRKKLNEAVKLTIDFFKDNLN